MESEALMALPTPPLVPTLPIPQGGTQLAAGRIAPTAAASAGGGCIARGGYTGGASGGTADGGANGGTAARGGCGSSRAGSDVRAALRALATEPNERGGGGGGVIGGGGMSSALKYAHRLP